MSHSHSSADVLSAADGVNGDGYPQHNTSASNRTTATRSTLTNTTMAQSSQRSFATNSTSNTRRQHQQIVQHQRINANNSQSTAAAVAAAQLSGEELEEYCRKRGLCPLCATTRTKKRVFKLFRKHKWEPLTITDKQGGYLVYRGYCVKPNCFTIDQARRLVGEGRPRRPQTRNSTSSLRTGSANPRQRNNSSQSMDGVQQNKHIEMSAAGSTNHPIRQRRRDSEESRNFSMSAGNRLRNRLRRSSQRRATSPDGSRASVDSAAGAAPTKITATSRTTRRTSGRTTTSSFPPLALKQSGSHASVDESTPLPVIVTTVQALRVNPMIFILDLSNVILRQVDIQQMAAALSENKRLTGLILENCKLDDVAMQHLAGGLDASSLPLVKLYLRTNQIGNDGAEALSKFVEQSVTLEKLDLSRNKISSDGGITIFNSIARNNHHTRLRCLNLSHNELWDLDQNNFGLRSCLCNNTSLRVLNLEANYLHDGVAESFAQALLTNENLERLYLGWNGIADDGCIALSKMLQANSTLRVLGLAENDIHNVGARALLSALDSNFTVREISGLWRNKIDRRFIIVAIRRLLLAHSEKNQQEQQLHKEQQQQPQQMRGRRNSNLRQSLRMFSQEQAPTSEPTVDQQLRQPTPIVPPHQHLENNAHGDDPTTGEAAVAAPTPDKLLVTAGDKLEDTTAATTSTTASSNTGNMMMMDEGERKPPFDRLLFFHASPLVYFSREDSMHSPIPYSDISFEANAIRDSVGLAFGAEIQVASKIATMDHWKSFFAKPNSRIMHLCCHGGPDYIGLENGLGSLQKLSFDELEKILRAANGTPSSNGAQAESHIQVVFVSSFYAKEIGQAFLNAGVPHVVCCQRDGRFRDSVSIEFIQSFYKALAQNKLLKQAYSIACDTVRTSPTVKKMRNIMDRFTLLPESTGNDFFHSRPVFFTQSTPQDDEADEDGANGSASVEPSVLPKCPQHFIGREVDMYEIIEALRVDDVVRVGGPAGNGRETVVAAACKYILNRKSAFSIDHVFWLPAPESVTPFEDSLYGDLCLAINTMKDSDVDIWENEVYCDCRDRIEIELEDMQSIFVIDDRGFSTRSVQENLEKFISHFLNATKTKIILITSRSFDEYSTISTLSSESGGNGGPDDAIEIGPLDFKSTALLFGGISKFIASSGCPVAHSAMEFAELLEPPYVTKLQQKVIRPSRRRVDLFERLGGGVPADVIRVAKSMSRKDFIGLIGIANRPEVNVDSLAGVEHDIALRTKQKEKATEEKNFLRAMDLDIILEELEAMRTMFPTIQELRQEEETMKKELSDAVSSRNYEHANDIKKDMLKLKKQIMKEQRMRAIAEDSAPATQLNNIQAQVQSMLSGDDADGDEVKPATFAVHLDDRDCSFEVYCGSLADFEHPAEAIGIVCWTNESCNLEGNRPGEQLLERGEEELKMDIDTLPIITETAWGTVKCGTGNAVIVGPEKYGSLDAPCVILTVGPLSPSNWDDIEPHDGDTLHYTKTMLQSSYRSSLVLVRHAQLQAVALSMLTTRPGGSAYKETLKVGLQTLVDEVKFSGLRDVHIVASSSAEATTITSMLAEMGLGRIYH